MSRPQLCAQCLSEGIESVVTHTDDFFVACSFCGAIDERATDIRNDAQVSTAFGTLLGDDDRRHAQFKELREKNHEDFVNRLLDVYLVDPKTRLVHHRADHFKAGARTWYNKMRAEEETNRRLQHATTNNSAKKVKMRVALAILYTIQDSNITIVNNRLSHIKKDGSSAASTFRGDGSIMAPTLETVHIRTQALGPDHIGYIGSRSQLRNMHKQYSKSFKRRPTAVDLIMSQVFVMCRHIERLSKLSWEDRLTQLSYTELNVAAERKGTTLATAAPNDFQLDTQAWNYMSNLNWQRCLEGAYKLYCATQVVDLWSSRHSTDYASALFFWGIQAATGTCVPRISSWSSEIAQMFGGNAVNALARRAEVKDFLVGWSTSIPDAGLPVPLIAGPGRSKCVGNGVGGFGGDSRRSIPELQMAVAAAPVIAEHWRAITVARLRTRSTVVPLGTEYVMAAKMFARAFSAKNPTRQKSSIAARRRATRAPSHSPSLGTAFRIPTSASSSRASSVDTSSIWGAGVSRASPAPSIASNSSSRTMMSRDDMLRRMSLPPPRPATPPAPEPSLEELLATRDDSSDEYADGETDDEGVGKLGSGKTLQLRDDPNAAPFAFSIGPNGFFIAEEDRVPPTVVPSRRRPQSAVEPSFVKRPRTTIAVPPSPPATTSSTGGRSPSPALSSGSTGMFPPPILSIGPSPTPSLRAISMSPSSSQHSLPALPEEDDVSRYSCLLRREREQYVSYSANEERKRGLAVSVDTENAMKAWMQGAKGKGRFPQAITPGYLLSLGVRGDPRKQDLGPFIARNAHRWSTTECLLRLGLKPLEFPYHHVIHSVVGLKWDLERAAMESSLAPEGETIDETQLDAELDILFADDLEEWRNLICSPAEANAREKLFLQQGIWTYDRSVPEGRVLSGDQPNTSQKPVKSRDDTPAATSMLGLPTARASSTRINYGALRQLMGQEPADSEDQKGDEEASAFQSLLDETLISGVEYGDGGLYGGGEEDEDAISGDEEVE